MRMQLFACTSAVAVIASCAWAQPLVFNRDVRPILSDRCFACHGPDNNNRKSKLRLDSEADSRADLGRGRFGIVPGKPEQSEVFKRITTTTKGLRMPPAWSSHPPLTPRETATVEQWIREGAAYQPHWAFIPPVRTTAPPVKAAGWARNEIDRFILSRLEREGLQPSREADKRTLLRRVTFDLTGLPPSPAEMSAFLADESPGAYEKVLDRLLQSTAYAERMAVRWLDAARYADTNGYQTDGPRDMWRWRDWVIDAFAKDMPWDRFTVEQIAGDLLPGATLSQKIATGFHRNHRTSAEGGIVDEEFRVEYVADRTETTSSVWLGLTVGCARCHDHKYDPIPQKDYYSLFAFFNNVPERGFVWNFGNESPTVQAPLPEQAAKLAAFDAAIQQADAEVGRLAPGIRKAQRNWEKKLTGAAAPDCTKRDGEALRVAPGEKSFNGERVLDLQRNEPKLDYRDPFTFSAWIRPETADGAILSRTEDYSEGQGHGLYIMGGKLRLHVIFRWTDLGMRVETAQPLELHRWQHVAVTYDGNMKAAGVAMYVDGRKQDVNILFDQLLWPIDHKQPWRIGAGGGLRFRGEIGDARVHTRDLTAEEIAALAVRDDAAAIAARKPKQRTAAEQTLLHLCFIDGFAPSEVQQVRSRAATLRAQRKAFSDTIPTVMVMQERPEPRETFLLKRGAYDAPGERVFPASLSALPPMPHDFRKDRLGLAMWLVDRANPLTARVAVNRFWAMLFGTGIVKTVEDFGSQGEWPVHPELLDWLAVEFMESGWSVRHILKTITMSAAYRQNSQVTPDLLQRDPENRLLARGSRFRLPAEMIRDSALAVSGLLVQKIGGPSVRPYQPPGLWQELQGGKGYEEDTGEGLYRRSLYTYWRRTVAPPNMVNFDAPPRETCTVRENRTNTPLQALNLMNDVVYLEAARKLAERIMAEGGENPESRIDYGFQLVTGRTPVEREARALLTAFAKFRDWYARNLKDAEQYVSQGKSSRNRPSDELAPYAAVASVLLNLDEAITKE